MMLEKLSKRSASLRPISLALNLMLKMFSSRIFSLPKQKTVLNTSLAVMGCSTKQFIKLFLFS